MEIRSIIVVTIETASKDQIKREGAEKAMYTFFSRAELLNLITQTHTHSLSLMLD